MTIIYRRKIPNVQTYIFIVGSKTNLCTYGAISAAIAFGKGSANRINAWRSANRTHYPITQTAKQPSSVARCVTTGVSL